MAYDLTTWTLTLLMLWAAGAAVIVWRAKPVAMLPPPKNPIGFMPPAP